MPNKQKWIIPGDYDPVETKWCLVMLCVPNTRGWRGVVTGAIYNLTRGRFWDEDTGIIIDAQEIGREIFGSLTMDCNNDLTRIADTLELIYQKMPDVTTLDEVADNIEDVLGIASPVTTLFRWLVSLFPSLNVKVDATKVILSVWEYMSWKAPLMTLIGTIATAQTVQAIALVGSGFLSFMGSQLALLQGWVTLGKDFVLGDWNVWDTWLKPLYYQFISDADGGSGGEDPDSSEERLLAKIYNDVFVEGDAMSVTQVNSQSVNCGGCGGIGGGGSDFIADESGAQSSIDGPEMTLPSEGGEDPPPIGFDTWESYRLYKCKSSDLMVLGLAERLYQLYEIGNGDYTYATHASSAAAIETILRGFDVAFHNIVGPTLATLPVAVTSNPDDQLLVMVRSWTAQKLADYFYPDPNPSPFRCFYDTRLYILDNQDDLRCALFNAENTGDARGAIEGMVGDYLSGSEYSESVKSWVGDVVSGQLVNSWLNILFSENSTVSGASSSADCSTCDNCQEAYLAKGEDLGGGSYQSEPGTSKEWIVLAANYDNAQGSYCGPEMLITVSNLVGNAPPPVGVSDAFRVFDQSGSVVYSSDDTPPSSEPGAKVEVKSHPDNPFTCDISLGDIV